MKIDDPEVQSSRMTDLPLSSRQKKPVSFFGGAMQKVHDNFTKENLLSSSSLDHSLRFTVDTREELSSSAARTMLLRPDTPPSQNVSPHRKTLSPSLLSPRDQSSQAIDQLIESVGPIPEEFGSITNQLQTDSHELNFLVYDEFYTLFQLFKNYVGISQWELARATLSNIVDLDPLNLPKELQKLRPIEVALKILEQLMPLSDNL